MSEGEDVRVPQYPQQSAMPRLFSDVESVAGKGAGVGDDGVGVADDGVPGAGALPGGALPRTADTSNDAFGSCSMATLVCAAHSRRRGASWPS
jgi:hypothetical protein